MNKRHGTQVLRVRHWHVQRGRRLVMGIQGSHVQFNGCDVYSVSASDASQT